MHGIATGRQAVQSSSPDHAVAAASLGLLCRVMEWDFRHTQLPSAVAARRIFDPSEVRTVSLPIHLPLAAAAVLSLHLYWYSMLT